MDLAAIRAAVADALADIEINTYDYYNMQPTPPFALVYPEQIPPQETMGDPFRRPTIVVLVGASMNDPESATRVVDAWISTGVDDSIVDALDAMDDFNAGSPTVRNYGPKQAPDESNWLCAEFVFDVF